MSLTVTNPSYDRVYPVYAWRDNNVRLVLTQGEGATDSGVVWNNDGTVNSAATAQNNVTANHIKAPRFQLRDEQGVINLSSTVVTLALKRPNDSEDLLACTIESAADGIISCPITASATEFAGQAIGEIRVSSNNGTIKFFGIHARIYDGVSDAAAVHSTKFAALIQALQKMAVINPDGSNTLDLDTEIVDNGTNPVASGVIKEYLENDYLDFLTPRFSRFKYAHETHSSTYDAETNPVDEYNDSSLEGVYIDNATELGTFYLIKNANGTRVGFLLCANASSLVYSVTQIALYHSGKFLYRYKHSNNGEWDEWKSITTYDVVEEMVFDAVVREYKDVTPDITFNIHNSAIDSYMSAAAYSSSDYTTTNVPSSLGGTPYDTPNTITINLPSGSSIVTLYDTETKTEQVVSVSGSTHIVNNLIPNRVYAYTVRKSDGKILSHGTIKATGQVRMIDGGGNTYNIRDLGGWSCNGGKIRYGLIYRGAELNGDVSLSASQINFFKNVLGVRDEIDFRGEGASGTGNTALGIGVDYTQIPIYYSPYALQDSNLEKLAEIIKRIARNVKDGKITYIHCQAGADRTAIISTFIEAICGVSQSDIDRDYELSAFAYDTSNNRLATRTRNNDWANGHKKMVEAIMEMEGTNFNDKVVRLLLRSGVTIDEINDIRFGLIDGSPSKLTNPYGDVSVSKTLSHVFIDNTSTSVVKYQPFEAVLTVEDMYDLSSVTLTMGGSNAASYYSNGRISIPVVTGNIVIVAEATQFEIVSEDMLKGNSVTRGKIHQNAVGTDEIENGKVTPSKLSFTAEKCVISDDIDSCVDDETVYQVRTTDANGVTGRHTVICVPATYQRTQYLFAQEGGIQFRKSLYNDDTWGSWSAWSKLITEDNVSTMVTNNTPKVMSVSIPTSGWSNNEYDITSLMPPSANANTRVDVSIGASVQEQLVADGCGGIYASTDTSNSITTFTLHAMYNKPTANITVQLTLTQLVSV